MSDREDRPKTEGRGPDGRFVTGAPAGPGRPAYPEWFRTTLTTEAMEHIAKIVRGTETDEKVSRAQACLDVLDRVLGKAKPTGEGGGDLVPVAIALLELARKGAEKP